MWKGTHHVNRKDQLCYECRTPEIDRTVFHICCGNFKIEEAPPNTAKDEIFVMTVVAAHQDPERERTTALCESVADVAPNVGGLSQEILELRHQGIEVDDDNDPDPDNAQPNAPETHTIGQWETPNIGPRWADVHCHNTKGVWREYIWPNIYEVMELSLFRMEFPEKWVMNVLIPETKEGISGDGITLKEFYVYLGCHFFMA